MEKLLYLSTEWAKEVKKQLEVGLTPEKMNNLTSSMNNVYTNCPSGAAEKYFFVGFADGRVERVETGEGKGPQAEFTITGDYETFAQISRAELGAQRALMSGRLKLRGNMVKALKLASLVDRINKIIATIPTQFE